MQYFREIKPSNARSKCSRPLKCNQHKRCKLFQQLRNGIEWQQNTITGTKRKSLEVGLVEIHLKTGGVIGIGTPMPGAFFFGKTVDIFGTNVLLFY
jgi:hypothetical protein